MKSTILECLDTLIIYLLYLWIIARVAMARIIASLIPSSVTLDLEITRDLDFDKYDKDVASIIWMLGADPTLHLNDLGVQKSYNRLNDFGEPTMIFIYDGYSIGVVDLDWSKRRTG